MISLLSLKRTLSVESSLEKYLENSIGKIFIFFFKNPICIIKKISNIFLFIGGFPNQIKLRINKRSKKSEDGIVDCQTW